MRRLTRLAALAGLLALGLAWPGAASLGAAARPPGPSSFATGFTDYNLTAGSPRVFGLAAAAGGQWVRLDAEWASIAPRTRPTGFRAADPDSPGYDWSTLDQTLRLAAAEHLNVLLGIQTAPSWAEGARPPRGTVAGSWRPNAADLGAFARALAERYDGRFPDPIYRGAELPKVTTFQIWNEPNLTDYLSPQWTRGAGGSLVPASPGIYRSMLNAAYAGIKSAQPRAFVMSAGTAPYGDPPGGQRMTPVTFLSGLFCLSGSRLAPQRCSSVPHLDGLDHHPYAASPVRSAADPGDVAIPDLHELEHIVAVAARDHHLAPAGPKPFWVTEIAWATNPPEAHGAAFPASVPGQARNLSLAYYELWRQGISHVLWYLVQDSPSAPAFTGAGVFFANGTAKPAATEVRFPFAVLRAGSEVRVWGRAPTAGAVVIQREVAGHWTSLASLGTSSGGVFLADYRLPASAVLRAVSGSQVSLAFSAR